MLFRSYALLTQMIAHVCGLRAAEFVHTFGDVHLYTNHFEQAREQLTREPRPLPNMRLNPTVTSIFDFDYDDLEAVIGNDANYGLVVQINDPDQPINFIADGLDLPHADELTLFHAVKAAFDPSGLLNPGKNIPTLHRCAEFGGMHVHGGQLPFPELERF